MFLQFLLHIGVLLWNTEASNFNIGDPRACYAEKEEKPFIMEVLPGFGWDNLVNENRGVVLNFNYSKCKITEDRHYLLPDSVITIPVKTSYMNVFSKVYDHWSQYESDTAFSVNSGAQIAGSFSAEYEHIKKHQLEDNSFTTKVQAKFVRYTTKVVPDAQLDQSFRKRLFKIAGHIQRNQKLSTKYESELLVRDFGTHVLTNVDAGASIVKVDQVDFTIFNKTSKEQIGLAASFSFGLLNISMKIQFSYSNMQLEKYMKSVKNSYIRTYGGPPITLESLTLNEWTTSIGNDLVAVDRNGFPLDCFISTTTLPELSGSLVGELVDSVRNAIKSYIKHNTYPGCTIPDAPNFNKISNVDDGSCHEPFTNFSFGGVFQECIHLRSPINNENLCDHLSTKHPQTRAFACPDRFEKVLLHEGTTQKIQQKHTFLAYLSSWIFSNDPYIASARYTSYWCQARPDSKVDEKSGFLFGGLYSDRTNNFLTQTKSCMQHFYPLRIASSLRVCISDDYELGAKFAVPFGGFYSCQSGNPMNNGKKSCPKGFSNHLAIISNDCEIQYCVQLGRLSYINFPTVHIPPFTDVPAEGLENKSTYRVSHDFESWIPIFDPNINNEHPIESTWEPLSSAHDIKETLMKKPHEPPVDVVNANDESGMSKGAVAGLSVGLTSIAFIFIGACIFGISRNCKTKDETPDISLRDKYTNRGYESTRFK